ncbi:MAG: hypothetical protein ABL911_00445 [Gallionella sp.]|nr:hypothetical protein [Gallionella sp.]
MNLRLFIVYATLVSTGFAGQALAHGYITTEKIAQHVPECITPAANTFKCARGIEREKLTESRGQAMRKEGALRVRLMNQPLTLTDNETEDGNASVAFSYLGFDKRLNIHIIHVQRYEGDGYMVINHRSGKQAFPSGYPIASPDGKNFLSMSEDMFAGYNPNNIEIWQLASGRIVKAANFELEWGPESGDWIDSKSIRVNKRCFAPTESNPTALKPCGIANIKLLNKKWKLFE